MSRVQWKSLCLACKTRMGPIDVRQLAWNVDIKHAKAEDLETEKMFNDSLKARAINYLKYSSLYTDKNLINCRFKTYKTVDTETKLAFEIANRATTEILLNKPIHMILSGKSGVGKSHLAMSTAWEVLEKSNYDKRCLFISYAELLEQLKFAMNDEQARKEITGTLMAEIKAQI